MGKLEIVKLSPILKSKIGLWDRYDGKNQEGYIRIREFLARDGLEKYFQECEKLQKQAEASPDFYGCAERYEYALNKDEEPISFMRFMLRDVDIEKPNMYVSAIVTHPDYQRKGYAGYFLNEILKNPEKYMSVRPASISRVVKKENFQSQKLFQRFGELSILNLGEGYDYYETEIDWNTSKFPEK